MKGAKSPLRVQSTRFSNFFKVRKSASAGRKDFFDTLSPGLSGPLSCPAALLQIDARTGLDVPRGLLRRHAAGKIPGRLFLNDPGQLSVQPCQHGDAVQQIIKLRRVGLADRLRPAVRVRGLIRRQLRL